MHAFIRTKDATMSAIQINPLQQANIQNQENCWDGLSLQVRQIANKVVDIVTQILQLFYIGGYALYLKFWEGRNCGELTPDGNFFLWMRRFFQVPVQEIGVQHGLDPRMIREHLRVARAEDLRIPDAPGIDLANLHPLFENHINVLDPQSPFYVDPKTFTNDDDTPASYEQLKEAMRTFPTWFEPFVRLYPELPKILRHVCSELMQEDRHSLQTRKECLIALARGAYRGCPTRLYSESQLWYQILKEEFIPLTFEDKIHEVAHDLRNKILHRMAGGDVHRYQEYLVSIGSLLGMRFSQSAEQDNPILMIELAPDLTLPAFFREYTPEKVIEELDLALNGTAKSAELPWERRGRKIPLELSLQWLRENTRNDYLHRETNTITPEGVNFIAQTLGILR